MGRIEVANGALVVLGKNRHCRILVPLAIFAAQVVFEGVVAAAQKPEVIPTPLACVSPQRRGISSRDDRKIRVLPHVMSYAIPAVDKQSTHGARERVFLSEH